MTQRHLCKRITYTTRHSSGVQNFFQIAGNHYTENVRRLTVAQVCTVSLMWTCYAVTHMQILQERASMLECFTIEAILTKYGTL